MRPTVVQAPDALVFINGEQDILGCPACRRRMDFNKFITSVQVDLGIDSVPGSASINMSIPRHTVDDFFFDGNPIITPMMEIEIFAKGFFAVEGVPQYYPIFWGMTTEVSDSYSGGEHSVSINCSDILKWWELCKMNINPAFTQASGKLGRSLFGNVLFGMNPYDIIWTMAQQSFGDVVVGSGSLISLYKENSQKATFNHALTDMMLYWEQRFSRIRSNLLMYGTQGNAVRGDVLYSQYTRAGPGQPSSKGSSKGAYPFASGAVRKANGGASGSQMVYDPTDSNVVAFRTQFSAAGQVNFWTSEYQTKLEIAQSAKEAIGFEFYMDVTGDIVFKPPFYNLDVLSNKPVSWIQDIDIIDWDLSESEGEVVTQIQVQGSFGGNIDYGFGEEATPFTSVTDYHLLRKYGWRTQTYNSEFLGAPIYMFYTGLDLLDRYNSKRHRGTVNIPMRPELRLGFPIYLAPKDQIWYIAGISHNLTYGGRATTSLALTAKRSKFVAPKGIGRIKLTGYKGPKAAAATPVTSTLDPKIKLLTSKQLAAGGTFSASVGDAAQLPPVNAPPSGDPKDNPYAPIVVRHPKTGRVVGYPNVIMAYTRPFVPTADDLSALAGQKGGNKGARSGAVKSLHKNADDEHRKDIAKLNNIYHTAQTDDAVREKYMNNRYNYGLNSAGVYVYLHDESQVIREFILLPAKNITYEGLGPEEALQKQFSGNTGMMRPVSDERGFEVIGHFKYGRGVGLRDGSLVLNAEDNKDNSRAQVSPQLTLSGELFDTLQAQSAGLGTTSSDYPNPAEAVTRLSPEDLQTAAVWNPETGKPEFKNDGTNFVDTAPLGSPEQAGSTNSTVIADVEASQLSRALTLAEMQVRDGELSVNSDCACVLGRADLAFINVGYQVKTLSASGAVNTNLAPQGPGPEEVAANAALVEKATELAKAQYALDVQTGNLDLVDKDGNKTGGVISEEAFVSQAVDIAKHESGVATDEAGVAVNQAVADGGPITDAVLTTADTLARVDGFLVNLYEALDSSHQGYEQALRGELLNVPAVDVQAVRFGVESTGGFEPPFSVGGRALGGDPEAIAKAGAQAIDDIEKSWNEFSDKLKANTERTRLEEDIKRLKKKLGELVEECERLERSFDEFGQQISVTAQLNLLDPDVPSVSTQLKSCKEELDKVKQDLLKAQQDLNAHNNKYPTAP